MGAKGKRGKSARRSKAGMLGLAKLTKTKFSGKHAKRQEEREEAAQEKKTINRLKEAAASTCATTEVAKEPHSFVIYRGEVGRFVHRLVNDVRCIMDPNTAKDLKTRRSNNLRDFIVNGAPLGVSHMLVFTRGEKGVNLRMLRTPQGPTLTFRVQKYTLKKDVLSLQKKQVWCDQLFLTSPLVVMNGFHNAEKKHLQVVQTLVQNMFPTINIDTLKMKTVRRCLMLNYCTETDTIEMRHYAIKVTPAGLTKSTKKLVQSKIPDLSKYKDISDFFTNPGALSESEWEDEQKEVELAQDIHARGLRKGNNSNIRLLELGPRLTLDLLKIEEGIDDGEVLYHKFVTKSAKEIKELKENAPKIKKMQERRRRDQEHRVIRHLTSIQEKKKEEEEEVKQMIEKAARNQAAATGQSEEVDEGLNRKRDREIALERMREEGKSITGNYGLNKRQGTSGGGGQNMDEPEEKKKKAPLKGKPREIERE